MPYFTPPSMVQCSVIRSRARADPEGNYTHVRSVKDLEQDEYCDPHDPCCTNKDPEIFVDQTTLKDASRIRKTCAPKNPLHFEYTILHRLKLRQLLQAAVERQNNEELTAEQLAEIKRLEEEERNEMTTTGKSSSDGASASSSSKSKGKFESPISKNPEMNPPPPPQPMVADAEQLQKSLEGLSNMALAHEIALNKDFKLTMPGRLEAEAGAVSPQVRLSLDVKDKYWRKVDQILITKDYRKWKHVVVDLITTLKSTLIGTIPPHNLQLREGVQLELDVKKIGRQIDSNKFDFSRCSDFILDTLAALCCPVRDKDIIEIRDIPILSRRVRKTLELMEEVNLDTVNFVLSQSRQHIIQSCINFERNSFANYIDSQYRQGIDPIHVTRDWIRRHSLPDRRYNEMMANAFCEILDWKPDAEWPETLTLDWSRFIPIRMEIVRVTLLAVIVQAVHAYAEEMFSSDKQKQNGSFESEQVTVLKNHRLLGTLRETLYEVMTIEYFQEPKKFPEGLESCANQAVQVADDHSQAEYCQGIGEAEKSKIREIVKSMGDLNNSTRMEYVEKILEWFVEMAKGEGKKKLQTPYSLRVIGSLVIVPVMEMIRLMMYNRSVFDILYKEIFDGDCPPPSVYPPAPPKPKEGEGGKVILDANKYGQDNSGDKETMDENIVRVVGKLRQFKERTVVYRRSKIDPRTKPMFEADGTPIVPPEMQPEYAQTEMTALEQKHYEEKLLATEPTLEEDYQGVYAFGNVGEPDWMFGYTTEQLLQLMERENRVNANKLRRIKERIQQETLQKRVADNLPVFYKVWGKNEGSLQKEYCRLQRILEKGANAFPPGATDEPSGRKEFQSSCQQEPPAKEELPETNVGPKVITSRDGGRQFSGAPSAIHKKEESRSITGTEEKFPTEEEDDLDMDSIARALAEVKDTETEHAYAATNQFSDGFDEVVPETALERLIKSVSRQEPTLNILDMRIRVPRKSIKPVWGRILGTINKAQESKARRQFSSMMSVARQIDQSQSPSPLLPRMSPLRPTAHNFQGGDRGTSARTVMDMSMGMGMMMGKMYNKSNEPQMPGTSDLPVASALSNVTLMRKRSSASASKHAAAASKGIAKFPMAPMSRRPSPYGLMKGRNMLN